MTIQREDYCADHTNNCCTLYQNHRYTSRPTDWWRRSARLFARWEGEGAEFLVYLAPRRDPSIVAALKKEYQDFYESIGFSRTAEQAKNALAAANPDKKRKQAVNPAPYTLFSLLILYL